jgi:hypothetical protein
MNLAHFLLGCGGLWEQVPYQGLDSQCEFLFFFWGFAGQGFLLLTVPSPFVSFH